MEKEKKAVDAHIDSLIVLWHIINDPVDDWKQYTKRLEEFQSFKKNYNKIAPIFKSFSDIVDSLQLVHDSVGVLGPSKIKKFYQQHQSVIDIICKYSSLRKFSEYNFDWIGRFNDDCGLEFFYGYYFLNHQDEADKILAVLERMKQIGLTTLTYEEDKDFTNSTYTMSVKNCLAPASLLDNMELIPNYSDDEVTYRTKGSNYEIEDSGFHNNIVVNSLTFDPNRLPNSVTRQYIFDHIMELKTSHQEDCDKLIDSVDLSVAINDLSSQLDSTSKVVETLKNIKTKEELREVLLKIKSYLEQLQSISSVYDKEISESSPLITPDMLQEEKHAVLERRFWNNGDID